ncbi:spore germination protein [Peribacillus saganii]|nr:spore germination protein [Peribacillus saganii]
MDTKQQTMTPIPKRTAEAEEYMKERVGLGKSFDLGVRKLNLLKKEVQVYYVNGLCDPLFIINIIEELVDTNETEYRTASKAFEVVHNRILHQSVKIIETMDELVDEVLSGLIVILVDGTDKGLVVDVRSYPGRQPQEPDTEKVIRGSRDGFVENIIVNTALTRRRIRDERLRFEIFRVGERSKTDIAVGYIEGVADPGIVDEILRRLKSIKIDGLTMSDKTVEEFLVNQGYNPYPLVRYTERADVAANHILEGHVLIYVDTSPSVIIAPTTIFHHVQHAEEYRQSPAVGTFIRWMRFIAIFASLYLLPFWFLFVLEKHMLPDMLKFIGPSKTTHIPIVLQLFIADAGMEFLRMAAIHTPTALTTAMGLIAAILIGEIAVNVGLFVPEVILYVAIATIGSFATPSLELSVANKMIRLVLLILVAVFRAPGLIIGTTVYILYLVSIRALHTPYLWPFIPFNPGAFKHILFRTTVPGSKLRPRIVHPQDRYRRP